MPPYRKTKKRQAAASKIQRAFRSNRGNMKKTSRRGAYRPGAKSTFQKRRAPFVETKRRVHGIMTALNAAQDGTPSANYQDTVSGLSVPNNDAFTLLNLASYYRASHGFLEHNTIGDSIYSKILKLKLQIRFPEGSDMIVNPVRLFLITGWCTAPTSFTNNTTITESAATQTDLFTHITNQLKEYFDQREDFLRFREKTTSNVQILKWQGLTPNINKTIAAPPAQIDHEPDPTKPSVIRTVGAVPFVNKSFTWHTKRKIHLSEGTALATGNDAMLSDIQNLYPNNQWLPFALIYNPEFERMRDANNDNVTVTVAYNDIHYYTDS